MLDKNLFKYNNQQLEHAQSTAVGPSNHDLEDLGCSEGHTTEDRIFNYKQS